MSETTDSDGFCGRRTENKERYLLQKADHLSPIENRLQGWFKAVYENSDVVPIYLHPILLAALPRSLWPHSLSKPIITRSIPNSNTLFHWNFTDLFHSHQLIARDVANDDECVQTKRVDAH